MCNILLRELYKKLLYSITGKTNLFHLDLSKSINSCQLAIFLLFRDNNSDNNSTSVEFCVKNVNVDPSQFTEIMKYIPRDIQTLTFDHSNLNGQLPKLEFLEVIHLKNIGQVDAGTKEFCDSLLKMPSLTTLQLSTEVNKSIWKAKIT